MPVSSGLQKYFDSQRSKKDDIKKRFAAIAGQVDPAFTQSFQAFHDRIMGIVEENPEATDMISEELGGLDDKLQNGRRVHNMKKAASIIQTSENLS